MRFAGAGGHWGMWTVRVRKPSCGCWPRPSCAIRGRRNGMRAEPPISRSSRCRPPCAGPRGYWSLPVDQFIVTDDRGARYDLSVHVTGVPPWSGTLRLHPDPPADIRWLDVTAPGEPAVRVNLEPGPAGSAGPEVSSKPALSAG